MLVIEYCKYLVRSKSKYKIHAPFMYRLCTDVFYFDRQEQQTNAIEQLRKKLQKDNRIISVQDYGAGSKVNKNNARKISDIVNSAAKSQKYAQILFRLVNYMQPKTMLELGTSLGISTAYQAFGSTNAKFISLEGCDETAKIARENIMSLGCENVEIITGNFDDTLQPALSRLSSMDWIFFDGNHTEKATLNYFKQCLPFAHEGTVMVFDDIYWSEGMKSAWNQIKSNKKVICTADLFYIGLVFFQPGLNKEHLTIRF